MPLWRNTQSRYGLVAIISHWLTAVTVVGLFVLGLWMTDLTYYDPWYKRGPDIHRSVGILLAMLVIWRLLWRLGNVQPSPLPSHRSWERYSAKAAHFSLYLLMLVMFVSGYLITTAEGQALNVFTWFSIPAVVTGNDISAENLQDSAGDVHKIVAFTLIGLATVHALAALKHHLIDKDRTLVRMLRGKF
jgi:cytochrome b561